jgi:phage terminase large subunit
MKMKEGFKWTMKQREALWMVDDPKATDIFLYGGGRSAKTFCLVASIIRRALFDDKSRHAIVRSAFTDVKNSIAYQTFPDVMGKVFPKQYYHINRQEYTITFKKHGDPQIWLCGVENNERMEKVLGLGLNTIFMNEISQIGYKTFATLMTRIAEKSTKKCMENKVLLDANPPAQYHWSYKRYILGVEPTDGMPINTSGFRVLKMNPTDNLENINEEYIPRLRSLPKQVQERYLFGEFAKGAESAVYGHELALCQKEGRCTRVKLQESLPVHAVFDIGVGDATAIWVCQFIKDNIYLLEYYEHTREALPYYINYLTMRRGYKLTTVVLPHDAKNKNWGTGRTIVEAANELGRQYKYGVHIIPDHRIADGINSVRMLFKRMYFDRQNTVHGFEALQNYEFAYSETKGRESDVPIHNWASHGADAFRYLGMFYSRWNIADPENRKTFSEKGKIIAGNGFGTFKQLLREKGIRM